MTPSETLKKQMQFKIGFEKEDRGKALDFFDEILRSEQWSEGKFTQLFEEKWATYHNLDAVAFSSWSGAALAALNFFDVQGKTVLCPSNTFIATPMSVIKAGGQVQFVDCNRDDLCISLDDLREKIDKYQPAAVWVVHIGGHIAFQIEAIQALCQEKGVILLEDCAHAHGASFKGKRAGSWGDAGVYSFYATKTISTGEGGALVTKNQSLAAFAKKYRNYGKFEYDVAGLNFRMSEFTAALACIQTDRLDDIIAWKNDFAEKHLHSEYSDRILLPEKMVSGYYKYIVFQEIEKSTGKVYEEPCHHILKTGDDLPNTDWVSKNHWCVPLYYKGTE